MIRRSFMAMLLVILMGFLSTAAFAQSHHGRVGLPTRVTIARYRASIIDHPSLQRTITNPHTVHRLFRLLSAMPPFPRGVMHCPVDFGVSYNLTFYRGSVTDMVAKVDAAGCQGATVNGQQRWAARGPFFSVLSKTLGISLHAATFGAH